MPAHSFDDIFMPSQKVALSTATYLARIFPSHVCLYLMGVLVQLKGTRFYRLALLPVLAWFAWRSIFVDMSGGDPKQAQMNAGFITHMTAISIRATVWAMAREPFRRQRPSNQHDKSESMNVYVACWNAWDLMVNARGIGWNWPQGLIIPKPIFETDSRIIFLLLSSVRLALYSLGFDACLQTIRFLSPDGFGSPNGGPLFDHTLPPLLGFLQSVFVSCLALWIGYFAINWSYQTLAIVGVVLFRQQPYQWPPLFDAPWLSTSLSEFWGRRWHQMMREFLMPLNHLFGQLGGVLCAFLVSGIIHDIELRAFGRGGNSVALIGFWMMNGIGVVLERIFKRMTGKRVSGVWGWMWTFGWLSLWGAWVVDEWAKAGRYGVLSLPGNVEPSVAVVMFLRSIV